MIIRACKPDDFEIVLHFLNELQGRAFDHESLNSIYNTNIYNSENIYLVAEYDDRVIGFASCHMQLLLHHAGKVAEVQEMFVTKDFRSKGTGKLLMEELKKLAKSKGAVQLEVTTRAIREGAIRFYKKEHFEDSHKKLIYYF